MIAASTDLCRRTDLKRWMGFSFNWMLILDEERFSMSCRGKQHMHVSFDIFEVEVQIH